MFHMANVSGETGFFFWFIAIAICTSSKKLSSRVIHNLM